MRLDPAGAALLIAGLILLAVCVTMVVKRLKRTTTKPEPATAKEAATEVPAETPEETTQEIDTVAPEYNGESVEMLAVTTAEQEQARQLLNVTYGLDPEKEENELAIRQVFRRYPVPDCLHEVNFDDLGMLLAETEAVANVASLQRLDQLVGQPNEAGKLWAMRNQGELPRLFAPLLEPTLFDYHSALARCLAALMRTR